MMFKTTSNTTRNTSSSETAARNPAEASPSPQSPNKAKLSIGDVANIFLRMRRVQAKSKAKTKSIPPAIHLEGSSGAEPQTHNILKDTLMSEKREQLELTDIFVCIGAVNIAMLLRATRGKVMDLAEVVGANCLVDEQWRYTIHGSKQRQGGTYKVEIHYSAAPARSSRSDPHRPVALENAKGIPGLMTIVKRYE